MTTLRKELSKARLNEHCKADLQCLVDDVNLRSSQLPKKGCTFPDDNLPCAVHATTVARQRKAVAADGAASERFVGECTARDTVISSTARSFRPAASAAPLTKTNEPFRESRRRDQLSGRDEDFVTRYAEALLHAPVARPTCDDPAAVAAREAYTAAFKAHTRRSPTDEELLEVNRLFFAFDANGNVGVLQKPHSCHPHKHVTCAVTHCTHCRSQVYKQENPAVRAARDRFPGPVPTWSSTKNTETLVGGSTYAAGHQTVQSLKRSAVDTVVGPK